MIKTFDISKNPEEAIPELLGICWAQQIQMDALFDVMLVVFQKQGHKPEHIKTIFKKAMDLRMENLVDSPEIKEALNDSVKKMLDEIDGISSGE